MFLESDWLQPDEEHRSFYASCWDEAAPDVVLRDGWTCKDYEQTTKICWWRPPRARDTSVETS